MQCNALIHPGSAVLARMDWDWDSLPPPSTGASISYSSLSTTTKIMSIMSITKHLLILQLESVEVARVDFLEAHVPDHSAVFHYLVLLQLQVPTKFEPGSITKNIDFAL